MRTERKFAHGAMKSRFSVIDCVRDIACKVSGMSSRGEKCALHSHVGGSGKSSGGDLTCLRDLL